MIKTNACLLAVTLIACLAVASARAETPEQWVALGARVHDAFGSFIPVGIRIGLDALQRLEVKPREVTVMYYSGPKSPCPCPADGIAIATMASPGQGTLEVAPDKAPAGLMGVAVIRSRSTGAGLRYIIDEAWIAKLIEMNKTYDPMGRYNAVMNAVDLFSVELLAPKEYGIK